MEGRNDQDKKRERKGEELDTFSDSPYMSSTWWQIAGEEEDRSLNALSTQCHRPHLQGRGYPECPQTVSTRTCSESGWHSADRTWSASLPGK